FISAREGEMDQVMALENGGDDYITKPVQLELLVAKVRGHLRRTYGEYALTAGENDSRQDADTPATHSQQHASKLVQHGLILWLNRNELHYNEQQIVLTRNELLLMEHMLRHYGEAVTRDMLLEALWDDVQFVDDNTLTVNM